MAYDVSMTRCLLPYWTAAETNLFLGYPDFRMSLEALRKQGIGLNWREGIHTKPLVPYNADGLKQLELLPAYACPNSDDFLDFFKVRGRVYVDHIAHHDNEVLADLNHPIDLGRRFDTVNETGTLEHLANPWNGIQFMFTHTKVGGVFTISQQIGTKMNHGFYSLEPNLFIELLMYNTPLLGLVHIWGQLGSLEEKNAENTFSSENDGGIPEWFYRQTALPDRRPFNYILVLSKKAEGTLTCPIQRRYTHKNPGQLTAKDYAFYGA